MNDYLFIVVLGTLGLLSTIISSKGGLFDNRFLWYKRLTAKGWFVTAIGLLIIGLSILQSIKINKFNQLEKDIQVKQKKDGDSTIAAEIKTGVDSSRRRLFNDLSEALAKQKMTLDTVTKTVKSLRDSAKTIVVNPENKTPELLIMSNGIISEKVGKDIKFNISFTSLEAPSLIKYIELVV